MRAFRRSRSEPKEEQVSNNKWDEPNDVVLHALWREYNDVRQQLPLEGGTIDLGSIRDRPQRLKRILAAYNERVEEIRRKARKPFDAIAIALALTTLTPFAVNAIDDDPWLPPEVVSHGQSQQVVGYVIAVDSNWTTVLDDASRRVIRLKTNEVNKRKICSFESSPERPDTIYDVLRNLFTDKTKKFAYSKCPDSSD